MDPTIHIEKENDVPLTSTADGNRSTGREGDMVNPSPAPDMTRKRPRQEEVVEVEYSMQGEGEDMDKDKSEKEGEDHHPKRLGRLIRRRKNPLLPDDISGMLTRWFL